jgi:hypothetical protein
MIAKEIAVMADEMLDFTAISVLINPLKPE